MEENTMKKIVSERKIKHWQGYGSVDAKVLKKTNDTLVVRVSGNHEYGLDCDKYDTYRVYDWLVKRFCPNKEERDIESVDIDDRYEQVGNLDVEVCDYTIHFRGDHMWQESADDETLKDIEKTYGKNTARALDRYCKMFNKKAVDVVSDMKMDGNGMTEWDKFDVWARRKLKLDIMDNFDDTFDWTGTEERKNDDKEEKKREKDERRAERKIKRDLKELRKNKKDLKKLRRGMRKGRRLARESMERLMKEGSGSRMNQWDIASWISDEVRDCEWANGVDFENDDYEDPWFRITTTDGDTFQVVVKKV